MAKKTKTKAKEEKLEELHEYSLNELVEMHEGLESMVLKLQENLAIVNSNSQFACDEIEELKKNLTKVAGRLGLWNT